MAYSSRVEEAFAFAADKHRDQIRKGSGIPYINHLMAVASIVGENGGTEDQVIAGLLHDVVEDCKHDHPKIEEDLRARFGEDVLEMVLACTDGWGETKPAWRPRKEAYLVHLRAKPSDHPALLVSLSDKVHNARSILLDLEELGDELWGRFSGKKEGTLWYYMSLAEIFRDHLGDHRLVRVLSDTVARMHELAADS